MSTKGTHIPDWLAVPFAGITPAPSHMVRGEGMRIGIIRESMASGGEKATEPIIAAAIAARSSGPASSSDCRAPPGRWKWNCCSSKVRF